MPSPMRSFVPWKVRRMMSLRRSLLPRWWSSSWRQNCRCDNSVTSEAETCQLFRANLQLPLDAQQHFELAAKSRTRLVSLTCMWGLAYSSMRKGQITKMADHKSNAQADQHVSQPNPALQRLDVFVGE